MVKGPISELKFLTHHEAAHAAVAFSFGLRLAPILIDQSKDSGYMKLPESTPIQDVLIWLAGGRAELVLDPSSSNTRVASALDEVFVRQTLAARLLRRSAPPDERLEQLLWRVRRPVLVVNPIQLASGTNRVMLMPDGRRSHTAVDCTDQLIALERAA